YQFAVEHEVMLIDEFDQIEHDIAPFLALPPEILRTRIAQLEDLPTSFHIEILAGDLQIYGPLDEDPRALDVAELVQDFAHLLPDLVMHASGHDTGSQIFAADYRKEASRLVSKGKYLSPENITHYENTRRNPRTTLINACAEDSVAVLHAAGNISLTHGPSMEFIHDHRTTMNFCHNPAILDGHGALMYNNARGHKLSPYFVMCKLDNGGELLMPALSGYADRSIQGVTPWSQRNDSKIFWRGRTTGNHFNKEHDWRKSHRIQLHTLANTHDGEVSVLMEDPKTALLGRKNFTRAELNEAYMDVGLVGPPTQCQKDGTCKEMAKGINFRPLVAANAGNDKKFALDVDGNGWSQRYQRLLASGSVVLKATIFPEWNTNWLIPYYHYIPLQHDYSDLYDTMAFFAGTPDGQGAHDAMAEQVSNHAVEFARKNWRWEDMQAYMFRLLLEYARLSSLDREKMTYRMSAL
ncbi:F-actin-capping protein subunit alpha, partial [Tulasnella sp. 427]